MSRRCTRRSNDSNPTTAPLFIGAGLPTLAGMAEATLGVLPNPFTMEDFLSGVDHLHGIADFRDISTMLKHLIDTGAMHSTDDPPGSWTRGPV